MNSKRVLVAFSSRSGSTAGAATEIAAVLSAAGLVVDCRPKEEVTDVTPYRAVVMGSGVFVARSASDGGGFIERHRAALQGRDVWLYSIGPLGGRPGRGGPADEAAVVTVARSIGARGVTTFGTLGMSAESDPVVALVPADRREIDAWALDIASALGVGSTPQAALRHRCHGMPAAH